MNLSASARLSAIMGTPIGNYRTGGYALSCRCGTCRQVRFIELELLIARFEGRTVRAILTMLRCQDCGTRPESVALLLPTMEAVCLRGVGQPGGVRRIRP